MASTIRTFIAVELPIEQRRAVAKFSKHLFAKWPEYRFEESEKLHLTLNFLGEVPDAKLPRVCEILREVAAKHEPFSIQLGCLGAFPKPSRPRILWLGIDEGKSQLSKLHYDFVEALEELRLERDRKGYRPHINLGRIRRDARWPDSVEQDIESAEPMPTQPADVDEIILFSSFEDRGEFEYTAMDRVELGG